MLLQMRPGPRFERLHGQFCLPWAPLLASRYVDWLSGGFLSEQLVKSALLSYIHLQ
jgi:hypothetical protein